MSITQESPYHTFLKFPGEWRFTNALGAMPDNAVGQFIALIERIASQASDQQAVFEAFKRRFGWSGSSSTPDWALTDMSQAMRQTDLNTAEFIDAFWSAMVDISKEPKLRVNLPPTGPINHILRQHKVGFSVNPPHLVRETGSSITTNDDDTPNTNPSSQYTIGEQIGSGGFGEVFHATRESPFGEFHFAIKFHRPLPFTNAERARARFDREVRALRILQHRGIVPYLDAGLDKETPFLVMPFIDGPNLRKASEGQPVLERLNQMVEILGAVAHAHSKEILHRDLKPANILVRSSDNQPVIVDFGLAYLFDDATHESLTTTAIGSGPYIPHEVWEDPKLRTPGHDIYSCGVILYEILAGRLPNPSDYIPLATMNSALTPIDSVIRRALAPAASRYRSAEEYRWGLMSAIHLAQSSAS